MIDLWHLSDRKDREHNLLLKILMRIVCLHRYVDEVTFFLLLATVYCNKLHVAYEIKHEVHNVTFPTRIPFFILLKVLYHSTI